MDASAALEPTELQEAPEDIPPKPVESKPPQEEKRPRGRPPGSGKKSAPRVSSRKLHDELAEFMSLPALVFQMKGDDYVAYCWNLRAPAFAHAVADLAEKNPALKKWLTKMMEGGTYGAVIWTGLALLVPVLAYYGIYPQGMINPFQLSPQEQAEYNAMMASRPTFAGFGDGSVPQPVDAV